MESAVISMNLTIAAMEAWVRSGTPANAGGNLGKEVGAMYREIFAAVDEVVPHESEEPDDEDDENGEDETRD